MIGIVISNKAKTLHFVGQIYKSNYFTGEQLTKFEILVDTDKIWDKTLAHFTELSSLRKANGNNKAANSRFESATHVRDQSSARSIIIAATESDLTSNFYIESLEESLVAVREYCTLDTTARLPIATALVFNPLTLL